MANLDSKIKSVIQNNLDCTSKIFEDRSIINAIDKIVEEIVISLKGEGKILFCGNGGSAADAQHLAAELLGRFYMDRAPLHSEALHVNTSYLTAVANDYSFDEVYSRLVEAKGKKGDVLISLSTSGKSVNVINAINKANSMKMTTVGLTGQDGGLMVDICKYVLRVPSNDTPRIQESHILLGHIICQLVEDKIYDSK